MEKQTKLIEHFNNQKVDMLNEIKGGSQVNATNVGSGHGNDDLDGGGDYRFE